MATAEAPDEQARLRALVVWDYDWSLIDTNSDTYVVEELCPHLRRKFSGLQRQGMGWTQIMDAQLQGIWAAGVTRERVVACVAGVPASRGCLEAARLVGTLSSRPGSRVKQIVLSDANTVFIDAFLHAQGLREGFAEVLTNGAHFDAAGRLRVAPYHAGPPHACPLCPPNLCKGAVIAEVLSRYGDQRPEVVVYVGDGGGDFCPACELARGDTLLCRAPPPPGTPGGPASFGLRDRIERSRAGGPGLVARSGAAAAVVEQWRSVLARRSAHQGCSKNLA